jgi:hypothetical protein
MERLTAVAPARRARPLTIATAVAVAALLACLAGPGRASAAGSCGLTQQIGASGSCSLAVTGTSTWRIPLSAAVQSATGVAGDGNATGSTDISMNADTNQVCASTTWSGTSSPIVWGHIHAGAYGQPENPGVTIEIIPPNFVNGNPSGVSECSTAAPGEIDAILSNKSQFNIVVHGKNHAVGAIRGQWDQAVPID